MVDPIVMGFGGAVLLGALKVGSRWTNRRRRRKALLSKYGDEELVADLMRGAIRMGMTSEHVLDAWGKPAAIDEKTYKSKTVLTYKYGHVRANQFRSRVKLENGVVVGWEQK